MSMPTAIVYLDSEGRIDRIASNQDIRIVIAEPDVIGEKHFSHEGVDYFTHGGCSDGQESDEVNSVLAELDGW